MTEFGCTTYKGAADLGARGDSVIAWDERARPSLVSAVTRDEEEQARYIRELLDVYDEEGADAAFVNTFVRRDLPTSDDPARDFDAASFAIVKIPEGGGPWQPKAAFHALADYGRTRRDR